MKLVVVTAIMLVSLLISRIIFASQMNKNQFKLFNFIRGRLIRDLRANYPKTIRSPYKTGANDVLIFAGTTCQL